MRFGGGTHGQLLYFSTIFCHPVSVSSEAHFSPGSKRCSKIFRRSHDWRPRRSGCCGACCTSIVQRIPEQNDCCEFLSVCALLAVGGVGADTAEAKHLSRRDYSRQVGATNEISEVCVAWKYGVHPFDEL